MKNRFRKLLYLYQDKRADRKFRERKALIENFDKDEAQEVRKKLGGKLGTKNRIRMGMNPTLQTVEENEDEQNETTFRKMESEDESPLSKTIKENLEEQDSNNEQQE